MVPYMPESYPGKHRIILFTALLLTILLVAADLSFHPGVEVEYNDDFSHRPDGDRLFPEFNGSSEVFVVDVYPGLENGTIGDGELLAMSCLQGLVNRQQASIYLDIQGGLYGADSRDNWQFFGAPSPASENISG